MSVNQSQYVTLAALLFVLGGHSEVDVDPSQMIEVNTLEEDSISKRFGASPRVCARIVNAYWTQFLG